MADLLPAPNRRGFSCKESLTILFFNSNVLIRCFMTELNTGINIVSFYVKRGKNSKRYLIENSLICQLPPEKRILLVQRIDEAWKPKESDVFARKKCFEEGRLEDFLKEGQRAADIETGLAEKGYTWKFLRSEMNRIFFGGLAGVGTHYNFTTGKGSFLSYLYRELMPEDGEILVSDIYIIPLILKIETNEVRILDDSLKNLQNMINLLIKKNLVSFL